MWVASTERYPDTRRLPTTATPMAVATCLVALKVPDAIPAFSRGTAPITASVVGARVNPNPTPTVKVATRTMPKPESSLASREHDQPDREDREGERDRALGADALGEAGPSSPATMNDAAIGTSEKPALSGE